MESMPAPASPVTVGVDTHLETHVAAVVDQAGRLLDTKAFAASTRGYVTLVTWAEGFGPVERIGIEGTGTYGAGLARFVRAYGLQVLEVDRPDRSTRRRRGKSDPIDAQAAARATLAGVAATTPKTRDGQVEMIRDHCDTTASATGQVLTVAGWGLQLLAWGFATLFVAGFTGAVRKT